MKIIKVFFIVNFIAEVVIENRKILAGADDAFFGNGSIVIEKRKTPAGAG